MILWDCRVSNSANSSAIRNWAKGGREQRLLVPLLIRQHVQMREHVLMEQVSLVEQQHRVHMLAAEFLDVRAGLVGYGEDETGLFGTKREVIASITAFIQ